MRGRLLLPLAIGVLAAGAALLLVLLGLQPPFAVAWALLLVVGFAAVVLIGLDEGAPWPPPEDVDRSRVSEVARLSWELRTRNGTVGFGMRRRVRAIARRRLSRAGVDLDAPEASRAVDAILGAGVWEKLDAQGMTRTELERVLDAIETVTTAEEEHDRRR